MNLKSFKILSVFILFNLSFFTHYIYDICPNFISSLFFPINESIIEHMKMIFSTYLIYFFIENKYLKNNYNNIKSNKIIQIIVNITIFLIMYLPIYFNFKHNLLITLIIYLISIIITQIISYKVLTNNKEYTFLNKYNFIFLIILFITFSLFTYYPIKNELFIDKMHKKIGFKNYY